MIKKLISVVIPAYNEEKNIPLVYEELKKIFSEIKNKYDYEIIFVNDGSKDNSWQEIVDLSKKDKNVKGINLSRNFWKEIVLTAGIEYSKWDAVITMDADGQHPTEKLVDFIEEWENWYDIVYNKRPKIEKASFFKKTSSFIFYKLFNLFSEFKLESSTTDYRLLDRNVVNYFLKFKEKWRLYRWIVDWLWFNRKVLIFDAKDRYFWEANYSYKKLFQLAINSLTSFSVFPLKFVWYLWLFITFISSWLLLLILVDKLILHRLDFSNLAIVVVLNTILMWIVLISLWLIALYVARIHEEVLWRPMYVVKEEVNLDK